MSKRRLRSLITLITTIVVIIVAIGQQQGWFGPAKETVVTHQPGLYTVTRFIDGDTIAVDMNGKTETVRMIGIDTPETHKPNAAVQCYGPAASAYIKNLVGTNNVRLQADEKSTNRDRYERLLRYVYLPDGKLVALELIKNGYGFAYTQFPFTKSDEFVAAQDQARTQVKGLWTNCQPYQQTNGRWQTQDLE
jgi:endonuclease YncB( thermonuclease family)